MEQTGMDPTWAWCGAEFLVVGRYLELSPFSAPQHPSSPAQSQVNAVVRSVVSAGRKPQQPQGDILCPEKGLIPMRGSKGLPAATRTQHGVILSGAYTNRQHAAVCMGIEMLSHRQTCPSQRFKASLCCL